MVNDCTFIGNLTRDPELRYSASGTAVCNFSIACNERFKDRNGEQQERTEFVNIVAWKGLAEVCGKWLQKGKPVYIRGRLQTRSYEDRDGVKKYISEIVASDMKMLGSNQGQAPQQNNASRSQPQRDSGNSGAGQPRYEEPPFDPDDGIPFAHMPECRFDGDALYRTQLFKW